MEFISLAVGMLLDYTVAPIARQVGYVIFYHRNVNELMEQNRELQMLRERVQHDVDDASRNGEEVESDVLAWLHEVAEMAGQVYELINEEHQANTRCSSRSFPNICSMNHLSRRAKKMKAEIAELMSRGNFDRVSCEVVPKSRWFTSPTTSNTEAESRESIQNNIVEALKDPNAHTVGVHGMPGVGKTTLVEAVAQKVEHHKLFDVIIFAEVTQNPDVRSIQEEIAHKLGLNFREDGSNARADRLHHTLILEQRAVLIIFDDVWENFKMDDIGITSVEKNKHLKRLMTSRSEGVLRNQMNTVEYFSLPVLPKLEAWKLFVDTAKFDESAVSEEFQKTATQVAEVCAGLPIAIVTIAGALRGRRKFEWEDVLTQLKNLSSANITGMENIISKIELSYDKLESELLKSLFLLCGVMRSHSSFTDLLSNAVGLDLLDDTDNMEEARNRLHICISKLKDSCLLLDSYSNNCFNMHNIVKEAAIKLASRKQNLFIKRFQAFKGFPTGDQMRNSRTVILDYCDLSDVQLPDFPNVTFFSSTKYQTFQMSRKYQ